MKFDSRGGFFVSDLGDVYADAISGISGMNPWEGPTSVDTPETQSDFAKLAKQEAGKEPDLAERTGWALHQVSEALRTTKIEAPDYDPVAEKLLIQAANLEYPRPARQPLLGWFYRDQQRKTSGRVLPKWRTVEVSAEEQSAHLIQGSKQISVTAKDFHSAVTVPVRITFGIDGHAWKTEALSATETVGPVYAAAMRRHVDLRAPQNRWRTGPGVHGGANHRGAGLCPRLLCCRYTRVVKIVRATLDRKTEKTLARPKIRKIAGSGKFSSGLPDLGSNKKHLRVFGKEV